jgi:hypothetical protein
MLLLDSDQQRAINKVSVATAYMIAFRESVIPGPIYLVAGGRLVADQLRN